MPSNIVSPMPGVAVYRPQPGICVMVIHYRADKAKREPEWALGESTLYAGGMASVEWLQEYEIDFDAELRLRTYWGFNADRNVVTPFQIPTDWSISLGVDFGQTNPTAILFFAQNPETWEMVVFGEIYVTEQVVAETCRQVYEVLELRLGFKLTPVTFGDIVVDSVGDPAGASYALEYGQSPWPVYIRTKGFKTPWRLNDRRAGEARVNEALTPSFACCGRRWYPADAAATGICGGCKKEREAKPMLTIMDGRAPNLVRTLPSLLKVQAKAEGQEAAETDDKDQEDHAPDALRYRVMAATFEIPRAAEKRDLLTANPAYMKPEELIARTLLRIQRDAERDALLEQVNEDEVVHTYLDLQSADGDEDGIYLDVGDTGW